MYSKPYNDYKDRKRFTDQINSIDVQHYNDFREVFDIYQVAKKDSKKAIEMLKKIEPDEDPIRFVGLLVSQALKDFQKNQGAKETRILKELSKLDIRMKTTKIDPWLLVESFLLKIKSLS